MDVMTNKKILVLGGIGVGAVLLFPKLSQALGLKSVAKPKQPPGQPIAQSNPLNNLLKALQDALTGKGSGGGLGLGASGSGSGSAASPSKSGGVGTGNFNGGNFGSYVVAGQLYDANGNGLDENGNIIPGVYDNSGLGPAGAGINFDGSIATNPLEYSTGAVISLNTPSLDMAVDNVYTQNPGGDTQGLLADARASQDNAPPLDPDLTAALLPSTPLPNLNITAPTEDNLWSADSAINNTPPDIAYATDEYVDSFPPADASNNYQDPSVSADANAPYADTSTDVYNDGSYNPDTGVAYDPYMIDTSGGGGEVWGQSDNYDYGF
jgi:hypothetical protein